MWRKTFLKVMAEFSDKKSKTGRISLSSDEYQHYDIFSVYMSDPENEKEYLFDSYRDGTIYALSWNEGAKRFDTPVEFQALKCIHFNFTGTHFYKGHRIEFKSLDELLQLKRRVYKVRIRYYNFVHTANQKAYNLKRHDIKNRMDVLDKVIALFLASERGDGIDFWNIMTEMHTKYWFRHPESAQMKRKMNLILSSFVDGGELIKVEHSMYKPTGKAYITQSSYVDSLQKHEQGMKLQKRMFWTAVFSFLAAAISAGAAVYQVMPKG